jgi:hypothetical protein
MRLLVFVEARPASSLTGELLSVWRNESRLIVLTEEVLWLAQFKDEGSARDVQASMSKDQAFPSSSQGQAEITVIPLEALVRIRAVQDFEDAENLYIEVATSGAVESETKEVSFSRQEERDQVVVKLQEVLHWEAKTEQVGLGQAIGLPAFCTVMLILAIPVYWGLAYFLEGKYLGAETWTWILLHFPINILGIKWTSIILGCGAGLFVLLLIKRIIRHPTQLTLFPSVREQIGNEKKSDSDRETSVRELTPERVDRDTAKEKGKAAIGYPAEQGAAADRPRDTGLSEG